MRRMKMTGRRLYLIVLLAFFTLIGGKTLDSEARVFGHAAVSMEPGAQKTEAPQQLSPEGQASLQAIIKAGTLEELRWPDFSDYRGHVTKFYDSFGGALPWVRGMQPTAQARDVIALLLKADEKGLSAEDYDGSRWAGRLAKLKPAVRQPAEGDALHFDIELTVCLMRYISDLHIGKVNPRHFDFGFEVNTKKYDLPSFLKEDVVDVANVDDVLSHVEPPYEGYRRTIQALQTYMGLAQKDVWEELPEVKKTIAPGDTYPGVPRMIRLLRLVGDLPANADVPPDSTVYQGPLVDAVKNFQRRHGRDADGRVGAQTLADMNVPLSRRVRQLQLTLERWRWLPLGPPYPPIV